MTSIPPPPPPLQAESGSSVAPSIEARDLESCRQALVAASTRLEQARCKESDLEASLLFGSSLLRHKDESTVSLPQSLPAGVRDAWNVLAETTQPEPASPPSLHPDHTSIELPLGTGYYAKAVVRGCIDRTLCQCAEIAASIHTDRLTEGPIMDASVRTAKSMATHVWLRVLDERLQEIQEYHAKHQTSHQVPHKRPRIGNPAVDGYDLVGLVEPPRKYLDAEVMGKYLSLEPLFLEAVESLKELFVPPSNDDKKPSSYLYADFLQSLDQLDTLPEATKLHHRKKYIRFLSELTQYLKEFLQRTVPLIHIDQCIEPAVKAFEATWGKTGGCKGWQAKPAEANMVLSTSRDETSHSNEATKPLIDLSKYETVEELVGGVDSDLLKAELSRLGLKCGGSPLDRAKRLFLLKTTPLDQLPSKVFVKKPVASVDARTSDGVTSSDMASAVAILDRRVDIARQEAIVAALLDRLAPTLDATVRRAERRLTQTLEEQDKEVDEDLFGAGTGQESKTHNQRGDDDDSDDGPIYNPKNVPLDFDGKPIPYWLFKLHGLNHYYPCEICGGESYRGRRNFELHFADSKHALGMRNLGIPNTKHFHGITTIQDAQELWAALQDKLQQEQFDNVREEEYEDSHGNVLSRATYEDLARQGLL